jgi:hypothetical protein
MNRLPAVLQNEIWEYVQGDRTYWKHEFLAVMEELRSDTPYFHLKNATMLRDSICTREFFTSTRFWGETVNRLVSLHWSSPAKSIPAKWKVWTNFAQVECPFTDFDTFVDARREYRRLVVIAARMARDSS